MMCAILGYAEQLLQNKDVFGYSVEATLIFPRGDGEDNAGVEMIKMLKTIKQELTSRIILAPVFFTDLQFLFQFAEELGMYKEFVWLTPSGTGSLEAHSKVTSKFGGHLAIQGRAPSNEIYDAFLESYVHHKAEFEALIAAGDFYGDPSKIDPDTLSQRLGDGSDQAIFVPLAFDAVLVYAAAIHQLQSQGLAVNNTALRASVPGVTVDGATGTVFFDENGNRASDFELVNYQINNEDIESYEAVRYWSADVGGEGVGVITENSQVFFGPTEGAMIPPDTLSVSSDSVSALHLILFSLAGLVGLAIIFWVVYRCKQSIHALQKSFEISYGEEIERLRAVEKRRLVISIVTDAVTLIVGLFDFGSDVASLIMVYAHNDEYSDAFVIAYFVVTMVAAVVSILHIMVVLSSIMFDSAQVRTGNLLLLNTMEEITKRVSQEMQTGKRFEVMVPVVSEGDEERKSKSRRRRKISHVQVQKARHHRESAKLKFKKQLIEKQIRGHSAGVLVGLMEDVPFYVLNVLAITTGSGNLNEVFLLSLTLSSMSFGFKLCIMKDLFNLLAAKTESEERMDFMLKLDKQMSR